ncbi:MAG: tetratricopeptide repeat protein [Planctomycetota bacterium]
MQSTNSTFRGRPTTGRLRFGSWIRVTVVCCALAFIADATVWGADSQGAIERAAKKLLLDSKEHGNDLSLQCIALARRGKDDLSRETVTQLYEAAFVCLERSDTRDLSDASLMASLAIASFHANQTSLADADDRLLDSILLAHRLKDTLASVKVYAKPSVAKGLHDLTMQTAWHCLTHEKADASAKLYELASQSMRADIERSQTDATQFADLALAELGRGWALSLQPEKKRQAARQLERFVRQFPDHGDARRASELAIRCLMEAGDFASAIRVSESLMLGHPSATESHSSLAAMLDRLPDEFREPFSDVVDGWLTAVPATQAISPSTAADLIALRRSELSDETLSRLVGQVGEDETGNIISSLLARLENLDSKLADEVARRVISPAGRFSPLACEAACRWAGRTNRWSLLASIAKNSHFAETGRRDAVSEPTGSPQIAQARTVHVDRLFAEALTREKDVALALPLWQRIIDQGGADDFPTLLRCAELAVARAAMPEAKRRLLAAEQAADAGSGGRRTSQHALLNCLRGELSVRQARFSDAREHYERVVRAAESTPALRGRAQWMIGETFFMQRQYRDAIHAYRLVESLDPGGGFGALSLVQAGKSYEQLGRTAEAGVCYGLLLSRHADSPHADDARQRLASLPQTDESQLRR